MPARFTRLEVAVALLIAAAIALSGPGYRFGWWPLGVAFGILRWGTYLAFALMAITIVHAWLLRRSGEGTRADNRRLLTAITVVVVAAAFPLWLMVTAKRVPPIHDIATDTANPPAFVAIVPLRATARNPVAYGGESVAAQQKAAYPDIQPLTIALPPAQAFPRALAAARAMGWTIIVASADDGRIEASDTTPFFGFIDDVVIRVKPDGAGSRIDVRSLSRIGVNDVGANARRIRSYLDKLRAATG